MEEKNNPEATPTNEETKSEKTGRRSNRAPSGKKASVKTQKVVETQETEETVDEVAAEEVAPEIQKAAQKKPGRRNANVKALELEIEKQKELAEEANDRYRRLLAEFENARARDAKESAKMYDVGAKEVLEKLLPVVDNFERAVEAIPEEEKDGATEQGVIMIYRQLMKILEDIGVMQINAEGSQFDPDFHNAVIHIEDENYGDNVVVEEMQKGYKYKDTVLRYSMVKVAN